MVYDLTAACLQIILLSLPLVDWQFIHCGIESLHDERAAAAGHYNE